MDQRLNKALIDLEENLNRVQSATELIELTHQNSKDSIESAAKVIKELKEQTIEIDTHIDNWLEEYKEKNESLFKKFDSQWEEHNKTVQELIEQHKNFISTVEKLTTFLNSVDFPEKLDDLKGKLEQSQMAVVKLDQSFTENFKSLKESQKKLGKWQIGLLIVIAIVSIAILLKVFL